MHTFCTQARTQLAAVRVMCTHGMCCVAAPVRHPLILPLLLVMDGLQVCTCGCRSDYRRTPSASACTSHCQTIDTALVGHYVDRYEGCSKVRDESLHSTTNRHGGGLLHDSAAPQAHTHTHTLSLSLSLDLSLDLSLWLLLSMLGGNSNANTSIPPQQSPVMLGEQQRG